MRTRKHIIGILLASLALLGFSACTTVNTIENEDKVGERHPIKDKRVTNDSSLDGIIEFVGLIEGDQDGYRKVQLDIRSVKSKDYNVSYKIDWYDQNGFLFKNPSDGWQPLHIYGGEIKSLLFLAPSPRCKDFRISFIESQQ